MQILTAEPFWMGQINGEVTNVLPCTKIGLITETLFISLCKQNAISFRSLKMYYTEKRNIIITWTVNGSARFYPYNFHLNRGEKMTIIRAAKKVLENYIFAPSADFNVIHIQSDTPLRPVQVREKKTSHSIWQYHLLSSVRTQLSSSSVTPIHPSVWFFIISFCFLFFFIFISFVCRFIFIFLSIVIFQFIVHIKNSHFVHAYLMIP